MGDREYKSALKANIRTALDLLDDVQTTDARPFVGELHLPSGIKDGKHFYPPSLGDTMAYSGDKPIVVCDGQSYEVNDLDAAQAKAEELAHQQQSDAFILKPTKKVSPKRDVVVTDLS